MKNLIALFSILILFLLGAITPTHAHEGHKEKQDTLQQHQHEEGHNDQHEATAGQSDHNKQVTADLDDFPNLHPLIVHFAIVLLIIGALLQLVNIYLLKKEIAWIAFALVAGGALAAYLAGKSFHPHTHELTAHAKLVLEQHDLWAEWTINLGIIGAILQGANLFFLTQKRWAVALIALILAGAGYSVSRAGHYGSQLVYIEGVGAQGKFLETGEGHSH